MNQYVDFEESNVIWAWIMREGEPFRYEKTHINHAVAGDTDSIMMSMAKVLDQTGITEEEEIVQLADDIGEAVNDSFPEFIRRAFNVPKDRDDTIKTDREIVSDKSFFLTRKRYIMSVINEEGKKVKKLKIMGVELKKSNTSKAVKEILMDLVERILDGEDIHQLREAIEGHKKAFFARDIHEIAKPSGCGTLAKCQRILEETGSDKGFAYQARAALFYNSLCGTADRAVMPGDKIGIVYIKHPQSKYIGYPIDATYFPDWMDDIVIDYRTNWEKAKKTIENYMKAMNWDLQTQKENVRMKLFGIEPKKKKRK